MAATVKWQNGRLEADFLELVGTSSSEFVALDLVISGSTNLETPVGG